MRWYGVPLVLTALSCLEIFQEQPKSCRQFISYCIYRNCVSRIVSKLANRKSKRRRNTNEQYQRPILDFPAISTIQEYNLDIDLDDDLVDFYNNFGQTLGWEQVNALFNDRNFQDLIKNKSAY